MNIYVEKINEVFLHVYADDMGIEAELSEFFAFYVPGYRFMPKYKAKIWDGRMKLYSEIRKTLYVGLYPYLLEFAKNNNYLINNINEIEEQKVDLLNDLMSYTDKLNICARNQRISYHDYQIDAINHALTNKRCMLVSPTASGKSLIIYTISRYLMDQGKKILVIVPSTSLVEQMYGDFEDYASAIDWKTSDHCQKLYSGFPKQFTKSLMFSTWQSIYKLPQSWFNQFDCIIGDEAHEFKSTSLVNIMEKLPNIEYRIGTTGSLDGTKIHTLVLEGLFGPQLKVTTTKALQDDGKLSQLKITALILTYPDEIRKLMKGKDYQEEIDFLITNENRNKFIRNLTCNCKGNTLVLFQMVEKHGRPLYHLIKEKVQDRNVYFIYGDTPTEERERIRLSMANDNSAIIVASYGVYARGINIPSIENIVFASPSKSRIRNLQSIGRGLRLNKGKTHCNLYDITDNLQWKSYKNHTLKHGAERYKLYIEEKFPVKIIEVKL